MKRNYVPEGTTYTPSQIAERNAHIDVLCTKIQPFARDAFKSAVRRQTANESAKVLAEEAHLILREVLAEELAPTLQTDEDSKRLREQLASALTQAPEMMDKHADAAWIDRRSRDLARAVAAFWVNLAEDETGRVEAGSQIVDDMTFGRQSERERKFELLSSRFWISREEARNLLFRLCFDTFHELSVDRAAALVNATLVDLEQLVAVKSAPVGSDVAVTALRSTMAATTAAIDSLTKATREVVDFTDASVRAATARAAATVSAMKSSRVRKQK